MGHAFDAVVLAVLPCTVSITSLLYLMHCPCSFDFACISPDDQAGKYTCENFQNVQETKCVLLLSIIAFLSPRKLFAYNIHMHLVGCKIPLSEHVAGFEVSGSHPFWQIVVPFLAIPAYPAGLVSRSGGVQAAKKNRNISGTHMHSYTRTHTRTHATTHTLAYTHTIMLTMLKQCLAHWCLKRFRVLELCEAPSIVGKEISVRVYAMW